MGVYNNRLSSREVVTCPASRRLFARSFSSQCGRLRYGFDEFLGSRAEAEAGQVDRSQDSSGPTLREMSLPAALMGGNQI